MALLLKFFRRYFWSHRAALLVGFLCIPLAQGADVWITVLIAGALNQASSASDADYVGQVVLLLLVAAVGHSVFRFFQRWCIVVVSRRVEIELKQRLFDKLSTLDFAFHDQSRSGDVVSRLTSDVENLRMFLGPGLMYTAGAVVIVPISLVLLYRENPTLALTMILPMLGMGLAMKLLSPRLHKHSLAVQESLAEVSHRAQENFGGIRIVKGYHREEEQALRFEHTSNENKENQIELGKARGLTHAAVHGAFDLTFLVILLLGGLAAIQAPARFPVGDLFLFIDLTLKVFWPLIALGWIAGMYPRAVASAQRIEELLSRETQIADPTDARPLPTPTGALRFEGVGFTYAGASRAALAQIDLEVPAGSTLGVVGPTGSGKSTLLSLVGRLYDATEGEVRLDDIPVTDLDLDTLRGTLGYVPQDSFLFSEPYHENVRFGADRELSEAEVTTLLERAEMTDEVAEFPDGSDTLIGERGVTLSGGQRQRTCIARALARDPRVLLLDDCLSAVDTETEKALLGELRSSGEGRTVVVAAHRLTTVSEADEIVVLCQAGSIEARGTHASLLGHSGWYRDTWEQQQRVAALRGEDLRGEDLRGEDLGARQ
ncbi:MAG: ABC transporter ATP-binding protein [Planctomycetota bacterium]|nr:ABC transporter ATP-binding protein [Planctomycetota bacterium]